MHQGYHCRTVQNRMAELIHLFESLLHDHDHLFHRRRFYQEEKLPWVRKQHSYCFCNVIHLCACDQILISFFFHIDWSAFHSWRLNRLFSVFVCTKHKADHHKLIANIARGWKSYTHTRTLSLLPSNQYQFRRWACTTLCDVCACVFFVYISLEIWF